jgi:hypothetical protein
MASHVMSFLNHSIHDLRILLGVASQHKEGRASAAATQQVKQVRG